MKTQSKYNVIGLMSGTSLDGLDLVYCKLERTKKSWEFKMQSAKTLKYISDWKQKLSTAHTLSATELLSLHHEYGKFLGKAVIEFKQRNRIKNVDFIASHGHTIFHQPEKGFTFQLGCGQTLYSETKLPVVFDFRSLDVIRGGEGAPLVPIGDRHLFSQYDVCLNLGGIANLSMEQQGKRIAFDFCFANMGLNYLSAKAGKEFDKSGALASSGSIDTAMSNQLEYVYKPLRKKRPSLGREGFEKSIQSILDNENIPLQNRMRTFCESIALETANAIPTKKIKMKLLVTGGGALNDFLIRLIIEKLEQKVHVVVPDKEIIEFKEALVFALLGVLRVRGEINCLKSVTGASTDSSGGVMIGF